MVADIENNHRLRRNNLRLPIQREVCALSGSFISYYSKSIFFVYFYNNPVSTLGELIGIRGGVKWYIITIVYLVVATIFPQIQQFLYLNGMGYM